VRVTASRHDSQATTYYIGRERSSRASSRTYMKQLSPTNRDSESLLNRCLASARPPAPINRMLRKAEETLISTSHMRRYAGCLIWSHHPVFPFLFLFLISTSSPFSKFVLPSLRLCPRLLHLHLHQPSENPWIPHLQRSTSLKVLIVRYRRMRIADCRLVACLRR
jgi:hypothetical protein